MGVLRTDENDSVFTRLRAFPLTGPFDGNIVDTTADFTFFQCRNHFTDSVSDLHSTA